MLNLMKQAYKQVNAPKRFIIACVFGIMLSMLYPSDLQSYRAPQTNSASSMVLLTENYIRFANTIAQVALPILFADKIGMIQLAYIAISTTAATHGLKRLVDNWKVAGVRLGERPSRSDSHHNMPSGHSSMASCAAYFVSRRYGLWHALYLIPILLLTMYARVALNAHTVSAVIAGALVGLLFAALFTSARANEVRQAATHPRLRRN